MAKRRQKTQKAQPRLRAEHLSRVRRVEDKLRSGKLTPAEIDPTVERFIDPDLRAK
jgi:hypothetical protein